MGSHLVFPANPASVGSAPAMPLLPARRPAPGPGTAPSRSLPASGGPQPSIPPSAAAALAAARYRGLHLVHPRAAAAPPQSAEQARRIVAQVQSEIDRNLRREQMQRLASSPAATTGAPATSTTPRKPLARRLLGTLRPRPRTA